MFSWKGSIIETSMLFILTRKNKHTKAQYNNLLCKIQINTTAEIEHTAFKLDCDITVDTY